MVNELIDTHAHLFAEEFDEDRVEMMERAIAKNIKKIILPNIDKDSLSKMIALKNQYPEICELAFGLHPCYVFADYELQLKIIKDEMEKHPKTIAIGEIGMDLYWDKTFVKEQEIAFIKQCEWAIEKDIPVLIHSREATNELIEILQKMPKKPKGVFHCFSGDISQAEKIMNFGMYLGIGGVLTYKKSTLPDVLLNIPISAMILETDSPYLPPTPHRGKRNESSFLDLVAIKLAEIKQLSYEDVCKETTKNAMNLFYGLE